MATYSYRTGEEVDEVLLEQIWQHPDTIITTTEVPTIFDYKLQTNIIYTNYTLNKILKLDNNWEKIYNGLGQFAGWGIYGTSYEISDISVIPDGN
jgi:hypothetical protein